MVNIEEENLLNDLRNFNEIFWKDVPYDNIKSHKNQSFTLSRKHIFGKTTRGRGSNWPQSSLFRVKNILRSCQSPNTEYQLIWSPTKHLGSIYILTSSHYYSKILTSVPLISVKINEEELPWVLVLKGKRGTIHSSYFELPTNPSTKMCLNFEGFRF